MADERECPACDTSQLGEWDPVLLHFHCPTCSTIWRRRPSRLVPTTTGRLPGTIAPMDLVNELPDASETREAIRRRERIAGLYRGGR